MKTSKDLFLPLIIQITFFFLHLNSSSGQENSPTNQDLIKSKIELGPEYVVPTSSNIHTIKTISFNTFFWTHYFKHAELNIDMGLTATYAKGTLLTCDVNSFGLFYIKTSAWGIGPVFHFEHTVFEFKHFSIAGEASGGVIFYSRDFPVGGDFYNFMFRFGGVVGYRINNNFSLQAGIKWMHVSNGQGAVPKNPTYEGYGMSLTMTRYLFKKK